MTNLSDTLESIQVERNRKIGKYDVRGSIDWSDLIRKTTADLVDKKHNEIVARLAKKREKYKDFP